MWHCFDSASELVQPFTGTNRIYHWLRYHRQWIQSRDHRFGQSPVNIWYVSDAQSLVDSDVWTHQHSWGKFVWIWLWSPGTFAYIFFLILFPCCGQHRATESHWKLMQLLWLQGIFRLDPALCFRGSRSSCSHTAPSMPRMESVRLGWAECADRL